MEMNYCGAVWNLDVVAVEQIIKLILALTQARSALDGPQSSLGSLELVFRW
jgi:hypothetical protein